MRIKYLEDIEPLEVHGDWIDLRCAEEVELKRGDFCMIRLGVAMEIPKGYEAIIAPRSSTFKKYHILQTNSIGVVDNAYCGDNDEWKMPVLAVENTTIPKNARICQFRLLKNQDKVNLEVVDSLGNIDRGGFGSTGV